MRKNRTRIDNPRVSRQNRPMSTPDPDRCPAGHRLSIHGRRYSPRSRVRCRACAEMSSDLWRRTIEGRRIDKMQRAMRQLKREAEAV